jgi:hypothetical protein
MRVLLASVLEPGRMGRNTAPRSETFQTGVIRASALASTQSSA